VAGSANCVVRVYPDGERRDGRLGRHPPRSSASAHRRRPMDPFFIAYTVVWVTACFVALGVS
jgi:hypothetical protein